MVAVCWICAITGPEEGRFAFLLTYKKSLGCQRETLKEQENKIDILAEISPPPPPPLHPATHTMVTHVDFAVRNLGELGGLGTVPWDTLS